MQRMKLIVFDLDGTLVNAYTPVYRSLNYVLKQCGLKPVGHATVKRSVGWGDRNLLGRFIPPEQLEQALQSYRRHHKKALSSGVRLMPGAGRLLNTLKKDGYRLAVASNRSTGSSRIILKYLGIDKHFSYILCGDKLNNLKPHPEILLRILKRFAVKPGEAVYVGDMTIDIETGRRAKVKTVSVVTGSSTREDIERLRPWRVISRVDEVLKLLPVTKN